MDDIVERLKKWLEKDCIVARNWGENGFSIDGDIELAIEEIKRLRHLTSTSTRPDNLGVNQAHNKKIKGTGYHKAVFNKSSGLSKR